MFVHAIFDVALDVQVALGLLVQAGVGFMAIFIESYGHALKKTWYKHVQRTVQTFLVTGHRLQDMLASSCIPQHMYMVLPGVHTKNGCSVLFVPFVRISIAHTLNWQHVVIRVA